MAGFKENLVGRIFGNLYVLSFHGRLPVPKKGCKKATLPFWNCGCSCGNVVVVKDSYIKCGVHPSCGCLYRKTLYKTTHGESYHPLYNIWTSMRDRCDNPNSLAYKNYGGRGIYYTNAWKDIKNFIADMGSSYKIGLTLERKDNNVGYNKENCVWVPYKMQARNKRKLSRNTSGVTGVSISVDKGYQYYRAFWVDLHGKLKVKSFSFLKYGEQVARELAISYRQRMIDELNTQGAGYGTNHGL